MNLRRLCLHVLAGLIVSIASLPAATITGITFSGPGGTGVDGGTFSNVTEPRLFYTAVDYIDLTITVDSAGSYDLNEAPGLGFVLNQTGQNWIGLNFASLGGTAGGTFETGWEDFSNHLPIVSDFPDDVFLSGGTVNDGVTISPTGNFTTTGPGTFIVRETPVTAPEPSRALLLAFGVALCFLRRRTRA
jgi:hypothetical protein